MKGSSVPHASIISEQAEQDTSDPLAGLGKWVSRCEQGVVYVSDQLPHSSIQRLSGGLVLHSHLPWQQQVHPAVTACGSSLGDGLVDSDLTAPDTKDAEERIPERLLLRLL